jgi:anti-sigma regulatory factor (Ser/Thr protein kinase)
MNSKTITSARPTTAFRHEAFFYAGLDEFARAMTAFIRAGLAADEPVLVVVVPSKIALVRETLGDDAEKVLFTDMAEIGRNPARIIPVWQEFVGGRPNGSPVRGIGEPIWAGRTRQEILEAQRHESLINLAFDGVPAWILCPYDTQGLDRTVVEEAYRSHPVVTTDGLTAASAGYSGLDRIAQPFDAPLPDPPADSRSFKVAPGTLEMLRRFISALGSEFGLEGKRAGDLVLAVNEVATNTLRHSGGHGMLRSWQEADTIIVEISDRGYIGEPLVGRRAPVGEQQGGLGLWIVNQLCDLVQIRTSAAGSTIRLHMSRR